MTRSSAANHGLYLHIPFCASICPYCDFSVLKASDERRRRFVETLVAEIELCRGYPGRFDTVYFGGGTPSLLEIGQLEEILRAVDERLDIDDHVRISLEANPEDIDESTLVGWRRLGVDTVSLGVQSFDSKGLGLLGRTPSPETAARAVRLALEAGFSSVSVDLIFGLPGQTLGAWQRQIDAAVALAPQHISCYQLTVHERTVFGVRRRRGQFTELADDLQAEMFLEAHRRLGAAGYEGYEVSNFAASRKHRSRHNSKYWDHSPYLGLGPAAHSFDDGVRWWNEWKEGPWSRAVQAGQLPVAGKERLSLRELALESLMLGLRTSDGVDLAEIDRAHGTTIAVVNAGLIEKPEDERKLDLVDGRLRPTVAGLAMADAIASAFEISDSD